LSERLFLRFAQTGFDTVDGDDVVEALGVLLPLPLLPVLPEVFPVFDDPVLPEPVFGDELPLGHTVRPNVVVLEMITDPGSLQMLGL